ncbi:hypothetical protein [Curtobacterium sp. Leaf261]|uniref:hypothetical protein n=1 Tax=Curtobacterium sp. Leaf261 TaxID=1736311 RepID=UPI0006F988CF|nr:hypothetical protein [Curtobacterium sp. Leaf261]KQO62698.1 hypothetical protein ASF23_06955 [Curtobacterium sp. Leaf261]
MDTTTTGPGRYAIHLVIAAVIAFPLGFLFFALGLGLAMSGALVAAPLALVVPWLAFWGLDAVLVRRRRSWARALGVTVVFMLGAVIGATARQSTGGDATVPLLVGSVVGAVLGVVLSRLPMQLTGESDTDRALDIARTDEASAADAAAEVPEDTLPRP